MPWVKVDEDEIRQEEQTLLGRLAARGGGWDCHYCGHPLFPVVADEMHRDWLSALPVGVSLERPTIDHVHPVSRHGSNEIENLVLACKSCNSSKGAKTPREFLAWLGGRKPSCRCSSVAIKACSAAWDFIVWQHPRWKLDA